VTASLSLFDRPAASVGWPSPYEPPARSSAVLSACERYRYRLTRRWAEGGRVALWVMLNPSTADATADDPTIRRCVRFALREGCNAIEVVNLCAWRATKPRELLEADDPVGPDNDRHIAEALAGADLVIAGWGIALAATGRRVLFEHRVRVVRRLLAEVDVYALALTQDGIPRHPLYLRNDEPLTVWAPRGAP
jgi:hypothetical protein